MSFRLNQRIFESTSNASIEIFGVSDASEKTYGAGMYTRNISNEGSVSVNLLCTKSQAAPLKKITLPLLGLCT